jgi:predicted RNA binding protein YcfA (HicA-like mRNA interferase family)
VNGYYNQVIAALKQAGYSFLRSGKGSHEIWTNGKRNATVPVNCASRFTANAIMKQADLPTRF